LLLSEVPNSLGPETWTERKEGKAIGHRRGRDQPAPTVFDGSLLKRRSREPEPHGEVSENSGLRPCRTRARPRTSPKKRGEESRERVKAVGGVPHRRRGRKGPPLRGGLALHVTLCRRTIGRKSIVGRGMANDRELASCHNLQGRNPGHTEVLETTF